MSAETDVLAGVDTDDLNKIGCRVCGRQFWNGHPIYFICLSCDREAREQDLMDSIVADRRAQRGEMREEENGRSY